ncbi:MAG: hypothetical protein KBT27_16345 [Prevotellaceae bacterium]|nr:hypothetical protein [Candidatus Faecinaster equi]
MDYKIGRKIALTFEVVENNEACFGCVFDGSRKLCHKCIRETHCDKPNKDGKYCIWKLV